MNFKPVSKKGMALSMKQGMIQIYSGEGHGKSSAALGRAIKAASQNKTVIIIQFLKGIEVNDFIKRLEPEIKFFHFEKSQNNFNELTEEQQNAFEKVAKSIDEKEYKRFLLYGVTGSRKNRSIFTVNTKNTRNAKNCNCFSP